MQMKSVTMKIQMMKMDDPQLEKLKNSVSELQMI